MSEKVLLTWSGGKDCALALYTIQQSQCCEIAALLTTITENYDRISMHGVRRSLLEQQAASLELPLEAVLLSKNGSNEEYAAKMQEVLSKYQAAEVSSVVFGDIFLEEVRKYREENLSKMGMHGIFPLWKRNTAELAQTFISLGFKAVITCVDTSFLGKEWAGRIFDENFLSDLPSGVDPCGENGEFHSFVFNGPLFRNPVEFEKGKIILRENRFYYCDLTPID